MTIVKSLITCILIFLMLGVRPLFAQKKALIILLDGIPADVLERVQTPALDEIAAQGGYARAAMGGEIGKKSESPTISAVGYTSLMTGTWANKHNVYGNAIKNPNYKYWTVFRMLRESRPDSKLGVFSTWEDNRTKILGEGLEETNELKIDFAFDGYEKDTLLFPHDSKKIYLDRIDAVVTSKASKTILREAPDLSWVYLEYTDAVGHTFGDGPEMDAAVRAADARVGQIWAAVQVRMRETSENWFLIVTTDHGRTADTGKDHGGQSEREREIWMVTNAKNLKSDFLGRKPEMVDVVPTLIDFFEMEVPKKVSRKLDGVSLIEGKNR